MSISIKEVTDKKGLKSFVRFPNELYAGNRYYVPQIESMEIDTLTPQKNRAFEVCEGKYWLALDDNGKVVGRIAGIINHKYNKKVGSKICRFGWIDFIESQEVVSALLAKVEEYARSKGMDVVDKIASVKTDRADRPVSEQRIRTMTVDTRGIDYPEPEKV